MESANGSGKVDDGGKSGSDGSAPIGKIKFQPIIIDPTELEPGTADNGGSDYPSGEPRKRGRPKGSGKSGNTSGGTAKAKNTKEMDVDGLSAIFLSSHQLLAAIAKSPELAIDEIEAKNLAAGVSNVARHYNMGTTQKTLDWFNLFQALALVYGTRIFAMRDKFKRKPKTDQGKNRVDNSHMEAPNNNGVILDANGFQIQ